MRILTRLARAIGTLRTALDALAVAAPDGLRTHADKACTEGAFTTERFSLDRDRQIATGPAGQASESWIPDTHCGHDNVRIRFSLTHCKACPLKARCTRSNRRVPGPRLMAAPA